MYHKIKFSLLIPLFLLLMSCEKTFKPEPQNSPVGVFENLWSSFDEQYALFDERAVNWDAQYSKYRPLISETTSDDQLFSLLSQMLASLDDGHVSLTAPGRDVFFANYIRQHQIDDSLFELNIIRNDYLVNSEEGSEESYLYGKISGKNIAYIYFGHIGENLKVTDDFLEQFEDAESLIIDLRHNSGGDFTYAFEAFGRFTEIERPVFRSRTKNGPEQNDFTPWHQWSLEPESPHVGKPIVVLTDRYTISAGERAVMALKTLPNVVQMGDTTNGAHGTMIGRELPNGWFYSLVPQETLLNDGKTYEGIGLAPDVRVQNTLADIQAGKDAVLEAAIDLLN